MRCSHWTVFFRGEDNEVEERKGGASVGLPGAASLPSAARRGPRSGDEAGSTRAEIREAALAVVAEKGPRRATIREIARRAGVDQKLVHYYYGSKAELLRTCLSEVFGSTELPTVLAQMNSDDGASRGQAYVRTVLTLMEHPVIGPGYLSVIRSSIEDEETRAVFMDFLHTHVESAMLTGRGDHEADRLRASRRLALVGSQIVGLLIARYVFKAPGLADIPAEQLAALVGPTLDRYYAL